jgi:CRP-like cAMP-binding protein
MVSDPQVNRILAGLPSADLDVLAADGGVTEVRVGDVLQVAGEPIETVYFPLDSVFALVTELENGSSIETATIGREGLAGLPIFLGAHTATVRTEVKVAGRAFAVGSDTFRARVDDDPRLCGLLGRYTELLFIESAQLAACNRVHSVLQRCARWLLMARDRLEGRNIPTTQAALAQALGVRRASVTMALRQLERGRLIQLRRGRVAIHDRDGLEKTACECYAVISGEFSRVDW